MMTELLLNSSAVSRNSAHPSPHHSRRLLQIAFELRDPQKLHQKSQKKDANCSHNREHCKSAEWAPPGKKTLRPAREGIARQAGARGGKTHFCKENHQRARLAILGSAIQQHEKNERVRDDSDRARERQAAILQTLHEEPIQRQTQPR